MVTPQLVTIAMLVLLLSVRSKATTNISASKELEILLSRGWTLVYYKIPFKNVFLVLLGCVWLYDPIFECQHGGVHGIQELRADLKLRPAWATQLTQVSHQTRNWQFCLEWPTVNPGPSGSTSQPTLRLLGHAIVPGFYVSAGNLSQVPVCVGISHTESGYGVHRHFPHWAISSEPLHVRWKLKNSGREKQCFPFHS